MSNRTGRWRDSSWPRQVPGDVFGVTEGKAAGKEAAHEFPRSGFEVIAATVLQVVGGGAEGEQMVSGIDDPGDEGVSCRDRHVVGPGAGPLYAVLLDHRVDDPLGPGLGQFTAEGADAGLERAKIHRSPSTRRWSLPCPGPGP